MRLTNGWEARIVRAVELQSLGEAEGDVESDQGVTCELPDELQSLGAAEGGCDSPSSPARTGSATPRCNPSGEEAYPKFHGSEIKRLFHVLIITDQLAGLSPTRLTEIPRPA